MYQYKRSWLSIGWLVVLVLLGQWLAGQETKASFDFTYTASDTIKSCVVWDTVQFASLIKNTGTQADSYLVTLTELSPTPPEWWLQLCTGGICLDTLVFSKNIHLAPSDEDQTYLETIPRSEGTGKWRITVKSWGSSVIKSKTFILSAWQAPVTNEWGIIILITLILASAIYLMYRRLVRVKQT